MLRLIAVACVSLMLAGCGENPPSAPAASVQKGDKGDKGDKGEKGDRGDRGEPGPAGTERLRVVQADQKTCASGCNIKCNEDEVLVSAICIRQSDAGASEGPFFSPNQARCRQASRQLLQRMTAVCAKK